MPLYEYGCSSCHMRSSALLGSWSAADPPCPHCGSGNVRRLVSSFASPRSEGGGEGGADFEEDAYDEGSDFGGGGDDFDDF
jgi:putative FmdB family regulatory protein